jgi:hypothetical protein
MTLAHGTPDAGSAKVGGGALRVGFNSPLKTPRTVGADEAACATGAPDLSMGVVPENPIRSIRGTR